MFKTKGMVSILLGLCLILIFASQTAANEGDILQKQREIDQYLFEDNIVELEERGIFVSHTRPFEDTIEIGISPYTKDHADYLYNELGKENITVVNGENAEIFTTNQTESAVITDAEQQSSDSTYLWVYLIVAVVVIGAGILLFKKKK